MTFCKVKLMALAAVLVLCYLSPVAEAAPKKVTAPADPKKLLVQGPKSADLAGFHTITRLPGDHGEQEELANIASQRFLPSSSEGKNQNYVDALNFRSNKQVVVPLEEAPVIDLKRSKVRALPLEEADPIHRYVHSILFGIGAPASFGYK